MKAVAWTADPRLVHLEVGQVLSYLKVCANVQWLTPSEEKWNQRLVLCS